MVHPKRFADALARAGVAFFTGVPDSLLKDFLSYLDAEVPRDRHITAANEGGAVAIAAGYHLATGNVAAVYLQNSGLGNAVNPLTSLADQEVYAIPLVLVVGWRGEPGVKDEPQHVKQGRITRTLLDVLDIPYAVIDSAMSPEAVDAEVARIVARAQAENRPTALVVRSGVFEPYASASRPHTTILMREAAIQTIIAHLSQDAIVVSTTGKISRELYEARKGRGEGTHKDFLTVGSMGHASQIALGIATQKPERQVYCLDGDGATLMHLGGLATVGWVAPKNFKHIVLNNLAHESVGGQPSAASAVDLCGIAKSAGYVLAGTATTLDGLVEGVQVLGASAGPALLEVRVNLVSRKDLGRPQETPVENKQGFMRYLNGTN